MNKPKNIYFDEAGFAGNNLLDSQQPYFVFGSVAIDNSDADILLKQAIANSSYKLLMKSKEPISSSMERAEWLLSG